MRNRRLLKDRLNRLILEEIEAIGKEKIRIASQTLTVDVSGVRNGVLADAQQRPTK